VALTDFLLKSPKGFETFNTDGEPPAAFEIVLKTDAGEELRRELLPTGNYFIGGEMPADLVLPDLDVPELCILHLTEELNAFIVSVTPLTGGLEAPGRLLTAGVKSVLGDKTSLSFGGFIIEVTALKAGFLGSNRYARPILFFAASLLLVAAGSLASQDRFSGYVPRDTTPIARPRLPDDPSAILRSAEFELRRRLRNVNLDQTLTVVNDGVRLVITGKVTEEDRIRLVESLSAARDVIRVPIDTDITSNIDASGTIAGVVLEPQVYVISKDGVRLKVGENLSDGSRIESIEASGVLILRDGIKERVALTR
jgi:hypothetical protein